jgi:hypothetical protein
MPDLLTPERSKLQPVEPQGSLPPGMPNPIQSLGYSAPLSPDQQTSPDVISQLYRGVSVVRHAPLPASANAAANAAANSAAKVIVEDAAASAVEYIAGSNVTFTKEQSGGATAINAIIPSGGNFWPLPNTAVYYYARATIASTALQTLGAASTGQSSGNGTVVGAGGTAPTATVGITLPITVGTGAGGGYFGQYPFISTGAFMFWAGRNCRYQARVTADTLYNTMVGGNRSVMYLGFTQGGPTDMRTLIPGGLGAGTTLALLAAAAGPFPGFWTGYINGTTVNTGVAIVAGAMYYVEIICNDTANTTSFSVNGSVPAVISGSNLSGFAFNPIATFATADSVTHGMSIEYMYAQQAF